MATRIPPGQPYGSLDTLLKAEIGVDVQESYEVVKTRAEKFDGSELLEREVGKGKPGPGRGNITADNISRFNYGTNADYLTARIARDHPDILERMKDGKFKSVRAAAKEAGIVTERKQRMRKPLTTLICGFRRGGAECSDALRCLMNAQESARSVTHAACT